MMPVPLVGDDIEVPCIDGTHRRYLNLDAAASTGALPAVASRVHDFLPWYSSVHRGAGYKSRAATDAYERARAAMLQFAGRPEDGGDVAIICRNTTEAINHLVYRLRLAADDVVVTTVVEHHANLLPWGRVCRRRFVECGADGTFAVDDVTAALDATPAVKLLAVTGASNVTGWMPRIDDITAAAHERGIPVFLDAAELAPHRPLPASVDFVAWSGHKMYAPFGAGALVGPRQAFADGDPFLAGGGAVDMVDLDEVLWTDPPEREEAGSPNVLGAVALHGAIDELGAVGWPVIERHDDELARRLRAGLAAIPGVTLLGPGLDTPTLPIASFTVAGVAHALVAARLSAEHGIGVRHGCFCAHPYLMRLLDLPAEEVHAYHQSVARGDRRTMPGAVRASASISTSSADVDRLLTAVATIAGGSPPAVVYQQDARTGDYWPEGTAAGWTTADRTLGASCARGLRPGPASVLGRGRVRVDRARGLLRARPPRPPRGRRKPRPASRRAVGDRDAVDPSPTSSSTTLHGRTRAALGSICRARCANPGLHAPRIFSPARSTPSLARNVAATSISVSTPNPCSPRASRTIASARAMSTGTVTSMLRIRTPHREQGQVKRRERDSNPRRLSPQRFSRPSRSAAPAPLRGPG